MIRSTLHRTRWILGVVAAAFVAVSTVVAGPGCLTVTVPTEVILPDGSTHEPGALRLCFDRKLNPVAELQEISLAGMAQGLYVGKTYQAEGDVARPVVLFHRNADDAWILVGFARPGRNPGERATSVRLTEPSRVQELLAARSTRRPTAAPGASETDDVILIAAR
jgi:hypothetical protein